MNERFYGRIKGGIKIKLYKKFDYLAYWFRYQATYLEMKYHLTQVINGKEEYYIKSVGHYDRNIGKSAALARLSAKYNIPIIVPTEKWKRLIERNIPLNLPRYFRKRNPTAFVINSNLRELKQKIVLIEECLTDKQIEKLNCISKGAVVGYQNHDIQERKW